MVDTKSYNEACFEWIDIVSYKANEFESAAVLCDEKLRIAVSEVESKAMMLGGIFCGRELSIGSVEMELASCLVTLESNPLENENQNVPESDACFQDALSCLERLDYNSAIHHLQDAQRNLRMPKRKNQAPYVSSLALPGTSSSANGIQKIDEIVSVQRIIKFLKTDLQRLYSQHFIAEPGIAVRNEAGSSTYSHCNDDLILQAGRIMEAISLILPSESAFQMHGSVILHTVESLQSMSSLAQSLRSANEEINVMNEIRMLRTSLVDVLSFAVTILNGRYGCSAEILSREVICPPIRHTINFLRKQGNWMCLKGALLLSHQAILAATIAAKDSGRGCHVSAGPVYREVWREHAAWLCDGVPLHVARAMSPCRLNATRLAFLPSFDTDEALVCHPSGGAEPPAPLGRAGARCPVPAPPLRRGSAGSRPARLPWSGMLFWAGRKGRRGESCWRGVALARRVRSNRRARRSGGRARQRPQGEPRTGIY